MVTQWVLFVVMRGQSVAFGGKGSGTWRTAVGLVDAVGVESWLGRSVRRISGMTEMSSLSFTHHMIFFFFFRPRFEGLYLNKSSNQEKIPIRTYSLTKAYIKFFNFFFFLNFHLIHGN